MCLTQNLLHQASNFTLFQSKATLLQFVLKLGEPEALGLARGGVNNPHEHQTRNGKY